MVTNVVIKIIWFIICIHFAEKQERGGKNETKKDGFLVIIRKTTDGWFFDQNYMYIFEV
jgi:hypothetical protein